MSDQATSYVSSYYEALQIDVVVVPISIQIALSEQRLEVHTTTKARLSMCTTKWAGDGVEKVGTLSMAAMMSEVNP